MDVGDYNQGYFIVAVDTVPYGFDTTYNMVERKTGTASWPVACVLSSAPIRFTRTTVAYNASTATKDSACSTAFGSHYKVAMPHDVGAYAGAGVYPTAATTLDYFNTYDSAYSFYLPTYVTMEADTGGTYTLACVHD